MTIELKNISVHYPGVKALDGVSTSIRAGEVHAFIGENGAGKSTLMNVLSGSVRPTTGSVLVEGEEAAFGKPADAVMRGIALVSQEGTLVPHLSAAANICLGFEPTHFGCVIQNRELRNTAQALLTRWFPDTAIDLDVSVADLPYTNQKIVEILRALNSNPRVLILDEPTATLPAREKEDLWVLIRKLSTKGVGVVLISHFLAEVLHLADHITALQDGRVVKSLPNKGLTERDLVDFMFNRGGTTRDLHSENHRGQSRTAPESSPLALSVADWQSDAFNVSGFEVHAGEIVGLIGLSGAGQADFAASVFQPRLARHGCIHLAGEDCTGLSLSQMKKRGVAYVPDHRMTTSLIGHWTVRENMSLVNLGNTASRFLGFLRRRPEQDRTAALAREMRVKMSSVEQKITELSGGNKQKVSISRWLYAARARAALFIFVEPTEGVDIGSKQEIHDHIRQLAAQGAGVMVVSSDLLEIAAVTDRVVPFSRGRSGESISRPDFNEQTFIDAIVGVSA